MGSDDLFKKRKAVSLKRKAKSRNIRDRILIVCEGEKTEKNYFDSFHLTNVHVVGCGANSDSLVRIAINLKKESIKKMEPYDQIWCVFDRDSVPPNNIRNAFFLAEREKVKIAWSNEAFEIWYLLHFNYYDSALSRHAYEDMLTQNLGFKYKKNDNNTYDHLLQRQSMAMHNANKLFEQYSPADPVLSNPCTTVHLLVAELNKWIRQK